MKASAFAQIRWTI